MKFNSDTVTVHAGSANECIIYYIIIIIIRYYD